MEILNAIILGLIQGLTEFIPVSSSGHLVLLHDVLEVQGGLTFDVALHIGTLLALAVYFWKDIKLLILGILGRNQYQRLAWLIAIATVPAVFSGLLLQQAAETAFRSTVLVSVNLIVVALIMLLAEEAAKKVQHPAKIDQLSLKQVIVMGLAQAVAVIPGVSRSGSTITAGLFAGIDRVAATRFSFLMAIPITFGAILKVLLDGEALAFVGDESGMFLVGIVTAFASGLFAIQFLLKFLAKHTLRVFAYYRIALGIVSLLIIALS